MELPILGRAGGESGAKNGAEIDQAGRKRASFSREMREISVRLGLAVSQTTGKGWRIGTDVVTEKGRLVLNYKT